MWSAGEAGGITQHIGAYQVTAPSGAKITFIDTPGHAAFTAMRARGAKVTDIVVLVVAADDGVMPQTIEAIHHAKAAKVPIIVAINKIDKPDAKPDRVRTELLQHEIQVESLGGDVVDVEVSANQEDQYRQAAGDDRPAGRNSRPQGQSEPSGRRHRDRGQARPRPRPGGDRADSARHAQVGDLVVAGAEWGRVRALVSDTGEPIDQRRPVNAGRGARLLRHARCRRPPGGGGERSRAREVADYRARQKREKVGDPRHRHARLARTDDGAGQDVGRKEFPLVIKADVQGSLEAIIGALDKMATEEVAARVLHAGVGGISGSDVTLAEASGVPIIAFNVRANKEAREAAERVGIEIRYYNIIYDLVDDVKKAMSGLLPPTLRETMLGNAQILEVFKVSKVGNIAGCRVTDGTVERGANVRLIRDNVVIHEGKLSSSSASRTTPRKSSPAWNAAWPSRTTRTCAPAT